MRLRVTLAFVPCLLLPLAEGQSGSLPASQDIGNITCVDLLGNISCVYEEDRGQSWTSCSCTGGSRPDHGGHSAESGVSVPGQEAARLQL